MNMNKAYIAQTRRKTFTVVETHFRAFGSATKLTGANISARIAMPAMTFVGLRVFRYRSYGIFWLKIQKSIRPFSI